MLENVRITTKLPLIIISYALVSALATGVIVYKLTSDEMIESAKNKLSALLESRKSSLDAYFTMIESDLEFHAQSELIQSALQDFSNSWSELPEDKTHYLQKLYIDQNPFSSQQKDALLSASDASGYSQVHAQYHPKLRSLLATHDFYDLFLVDQHGDLIYSVIKERDFATNLPNGKWKDTDLAMVFNHVLDNPVPGEHPYSDFAAYAPSDDSPASFIASPVFDNKHNFLGALIIQMPITTLNNVMQVTAGMGETGETYLVGADLLMRSDSRFLTNRSILETRVDTPHVQYALEGRSGVDLIHDYRGELVYSAYDAIDFKNVRWAILAEMDQEEVLHSLSAISWMLALSAVLIATSISIVGFALSKTLSKPIESMTDAMVSLSRNDLDAEIAVSERDDEIGDMANAVRLMKNKTVENHSMQKKLSHLANHDQLSGLPTRKFAMQRLADAISWAQENKKLVAVMFADIDNFKVVNDNLGHHVGDEVIKVVAQKINDAIREEDTVGRIGGDEFIIILNGLDSPENAKKIANNIAQAVNTEVAFLNSQYSISISLGISLYPIDAQDPSMLIRKADEAMYQAKQMGKNTACHLRKQA